MILITGDTHGQTDIDKLYRLKDMNLTYDDYLIILGDTGIMWNGDKNNNYLLRWYKKNVPCTILFIDGNHDNHAALEKLDISQWNGGDVHIINKQIIHLMRGEVFIINNKIFFTMGGGNSVDKYHRIEGISWWKGEMPTREEYIIANNTLEKYEYKVDYILTHECPELFLNDVIPFSAKMAFGDIDPHKLNYYFNELYKKLDFKKWYFGHYHNDYIVNEKCRCLFHDIIELP